MTSIAHALRLAVAAVFFVAIGSPSIARAADAQKQTIVIISLIGDEFSVVLRRRPGSERRIGANETRLLPVPDATFDRMALTAAENAIRKAQPDTNVLQASIRDARLFAAQDGLLQDTADSHELREALRGLLGQYGATRLLLVTKRRAPASFQLRNHTIGDGMLNGIGFYVDNTTTLVHVGSNENSPGFLSPFAYATVSLLDAATMRTIRSQAATETTMALTVDNKDAVKAWDSLGPEAKVDALERAIRSAVGRATTAVLAD